MIKLIFVALCLVAGASALVPWSSNPILPGYPVFFLSWGSWPYFCDTVTTSNKQCFEDCMNGNNMGRYIDDANSIVPLCPPLVHAQGKCTVPWRKPACQCAKRCECKLGRCHNANCHFCRQT